MRNGKKPLLVALLAVCLLAVGLGSSASASDYVYSVEAESVGYALNPWSMTVHAYGNADWAATGTIEVRETQTGTLLVTGEVACLYVNEADRVAIAAGPVTSEPGGLEWGDGIMFIGRDAPSGDGLLPGGIDGLVSDWPGFCSSEIFYPAWTHSIPPVAFGNIVIFGIDTIADVLGDFEAAVAAGDLTAVGGQGNLHAFRNKLTNVAKWLEEGDVEAACAGLLQMQQRCDGLTPPKDWVQGTAEAMQKLAAGIAGLIAQNGC